MSFPYFNNVHGWLDIRALNFTKYFREKFLGLIPFDSLEIGVHHGKFFIGIENITPVENRCIAIDVFSGQEKNIDGSGKGDLSIFNSNLLRYARGYDRVTALAMDSLDINCVELGLGKFGIISVDGGHTERHTLRDLISAQELISNSGIVVLDDIFNQDWCGVISGTAAFFRSSAANRIVPFAIGFNKLFCCHFTLSESIKKAVMADKELLSEMGIKPFKITEFMGCNVISLK